MRRKSGDALPPDKRRKKPKRLPKKEGQLVGKMPKLTKEDLVDAELMLQRGYPLSAIMERLALTSNQLDYVRKNMKILKEKADIVKEVLADNWYLLAQTAMDHITSEKLEAATAHQLTQIAAAATEKARVMEGKPTEIIARYEEVVKKYIYQSESKPPKEGEDGVIVVQPTEV